MLSSISPLGERARHNRWAVTVTWYVVASTATALFIGAALGGLGRLLGLPLPARAGILAALAVACRSRRRGPLAAARPPPAGRRGLARALPGLGLRRRIRRPARRRRHHHRHHRDDLAVPGVRAAERLGGRRRRHRRRLRPPAGRAGAGRRGHPQLRPAAVTAPHASPTSHRPPGGWRWPRAGLAAVGLGMIAGIGGS